jgi:prefoldin beta subunit
MAQQRQVHPELKPLMDEYEALDKEQKSLGDTKQQYLTQFNENKFVQDEFEHLNEDDAVFKLIGVVMVKQEHGDAKSNISRRLEMIENQIKDVTKKMEDTESKQSALYDRYRVKQEALVAKAKAEAEAEQ